MKYRSANFLAYISMYIGIHFHTVSYVRFQSEVLLFVHFRTL